MATLMERYGLTGLSLDEGYDLLNELMEWIDDAADAPTSLSPAHMQDLRRRIEEYRHDPLAGSPWEEIKASLRGTGP